MDYEQRERILFKLALRIQTMAVEYAGNPAKGRTDGFSPVPQTFFPNREIGYNGLPTSRMSDYERWLRGIAASKLPAGCDWNVKTYMGPYGAFLCIEGVNGPFMDEGGTPAMLRDG